MNVDISIKKFNEVASKSEAIKMKIIVQKFPRGRREVVRSYEVIITLTLVCEYHTF